MDSQKSSRLQKIFGTRPFWASLHLVVFAGLLISIILADTKEGEQAWFSPFAVAAMFFTVSAALILSFDGGMLLRKAYLQRRYGMKAQKLGVILGYFFLIPLLAVVGLYVSSWVVAQQADTPLNNTRARTLLMDCKVTRLVNVQDGTIKLYLKESELSWLQKYSNSDYHYRVVRAGYTGQLPAIMQIAEVKQKCGY